MSTKRGRPFEKGRSGNPAGRSRAEAAEARDVAIDIRKETKGGTVIRDAVLRVMNDPNAEDADILRAAALAWERGWGKPLVTIDAQVHHTADGAPSDAASGLFSDDNLSKLGEDELPILIHLHEIMGAPVHRTTPEQWIGHDRLLLEQFCRLPACRRGDLLAAMQAEHAALPEHPSEYHQQKRRERLGELQAERALVLEAELAQVDADDPAALAADLDALESEDGS